MSLLRTWIARGSIVSAAPIVEYGSRFVRTAVLSRLLGPSEFGVSVAITTVIAIASLVSDLSLDKFVVLHSAEDQPRSLAAAHLLTIARGLLLALVLLATASATAAIFGVPQYTKSFIVAALFPFIGSFAHLSIKQIQQRFQYAQETVAQLITQLSALVMVIAAAYYFRDHRAILASFLTEASVYTIISHFLASDRYRIYSDWATIRQAAIFGAPLLLNGLGLAAMAQLDRMLVGSWLGVETLADYAVILSLAILPTSLVFRVFGTMTAPSLLRYRNQPSYSSHYVLLMFFTDLLAVSYSLFAALVLDWLTPAIFGQAYRVSYGVHLIIVLTVFMRLLRGMAPTTHFLVAGRTGELARLNMLSGVGLLCAFGLLHYWLSIEAVLLGLLIGDGISNAFVFFASSAKGAGGRPRGLLLADLAMSFITLAVVTGMLFWHPQPTWSARIAICLVGLIGIAAQAAVGFRNHGGIELLLRRTAV